MKLQVYSCDVGVLLNETDEGYECYRTVYGRKHSFFDEYQRGFLDKDDAIAYAREYVEDGVEDTYAVVSNQGVLNLGIDSPEDFDPDGIVEKFSYALEDVVYSARKRGGIIEEDFLGRTEE